MTTRTMPAEIQIDNLSSLISALEKIEDDIGNVPVFINYMEFTSDPVRIATGLATSDPLLGLPRERLEVVIKLYHDSDDFIDYL